MNRCYRFIAGKDGYDGGRIILAGVVLSKKCHEAHQIDQRNVLNAKMYVVGAKNHFLSRVKSGENWPKFSGRISSSSSSPPLYPSLIGALGPIGCRSWRLQGEQLTGCPLRRPHVHSMAWAVVIAVLFLQHDSSARRR